MKLAHLTFPLIFGCTETAATDVSTRTLDTKPTEAAPIVDSPLRAFGGQAVPSVDPAPTSLQTPSDSLLERSAEQIFRELIAYADGVGVITTTSQSTRYRSDGAIVTDHNFSISHIFDGSIDSPVTTLGGVISTDSLGVSHSPQLQLGKPYVVAVRARTNGDIAIREAWPVEGSIVQVGDRAISLEDLQQISAGEQRP